MKNHYKFWIVLSFLVVFAAGLVSGVILEKNILNPRPDRRSNDARRGERAHFPTVTELAETLGLSAEQQDRIQEVFQQGEERIKMVRKDIGDQYRALQIRFLEEIKAVLDPGQVEKFDAMLEEYRAQRHAEAERRQQHTPRPKKKEEDQ